MPSRSSGPRAYTCAVSMVYASLRTAHEGPGADRGVGYPECGGRPPGRKPDLESSSTSGSEGSCYSLHVHPYFHSSGHTPAGPSPRRTGDRELTGNAQAWVDVGQDDPGKKFNLHTTFASSLQGQALKEVRELETG